MTKLCIGCKYLYGYKFEGPKAPGIINFTLKQIGFKTLLKMYPFLINN